MRWINELSTIKQESMENQSALIDELTRRFVTCANPIPFEVLDDELLAFSQESTSRAMQYCLCSLIAADIATVPYAEGRNSHMSVLKDVAASYGLSIDKIIYATRFEQQIENHLAKLENDEDV